jgi:hypothetical protein
MRNPSARYRLWQLLASLRALFVVPKDDEARQLLSREEYALFRGMKRYDRAHGLRVFRHLQETEVDDPALLKAALLHDVGKSAGGESIPLLYRGAIVITKGFPKLWTWLSQERPAGDPRRPFYLYATHARRSAELARAAGSIDEVIALIAVHDDQEATGKARLLQAADRQN